MLVCVERPLWGIITDQVEDKRFTPEQFSWTLRKTDQADKRQRGFLEEGSGKLWVWQ